MPNPWLNEHRSTAAMNYFLRFQSRDSSYPMRIFQNIRKIMIFSKLFTLFQDLIEYLHSFSPISLITKSDILFLKGILSLIMMIFFCQDDFLQGVN